MRESNYIKQFEPIYPGIDIWFHKTVVNDSNKKLWECSHFYETVGLVIIDLKQGKLCHISTHPLYRGRGIGKFLYDQAIRQFKKDGINEIFAHGLPSIISTFKSQIDQSWIVDSEIGKFGRISTDNDLLIRKKIN